MRSASGWPAAPATTAATGWSRRAICIAPASRCRPRCSATRSACPTMPARRWPTRCSDGVAVSDRTPDAPCDLVIDALLGLGASRAPQGALAEAIAAINALQTPVLAVDLPSGLHADTGQRLGAAAVTATHTLSLLTLKPGLFTGVGRDHAGQIWLDALGVPSHGRQRHGTSVRRRRPAGARAARPCQPQGQPRRPGGGRRRGRHDRRRVAGGPRGAGQRRRARVRQPARCRRTAL